MDRLRFIKAFFAHGIGQAGTIFAQLVSVPLFLSIWGAGKYGEWILISTIPTYLVLSDFGLASVAANEMDVLFAKKEIDRVISIYRTTVIAVLILVSIILLIIGTLWMAGGKYLPVGKFFSPDQIRWSVFVLAIDMGVSVLFGPPCAALRCSGKYPLSVSITNSTRLAATIGGLLALVIWRDPIAVAGGMLAARCIGFFVVLVLVKRYCTWIKLFPLNVDWEWLKRTVGPSLAFLGFPLGNALNFQGLLWVVGLSLGPAHVAIFATMRTLTRVSLQLLILLSNSVWSEVSRLFGSGQIAAIARLKKKLDQVTFISASGLAVIFFFGGQRFYELWTHKTGLFDPVVFHILLISMIFNAMWQSSTIFLIAVNRHSRFAVAYLISIGACILAASVTGHFFGLPAIAACLVVMDGFLAVLGNYQVRQRFFVH